MSIEGPASLARRLCAIICDDGTLRRDCLAIALRSHGIDSESAWDLESFLSRVQARVPDLVLLDIGTPDSATLLQISLDLDGQSRVIVTGLSADDESEIVLCAEAGVAGLHLRTESLDELLTLIEETAHDEPACSPAITAILMRRVYALAGQRNLDGEHSGLALTEREKQILGLLEEGLTNQQIASRLSVSVHTVKNHAHSLFGKLGVSSRAEAVATYRAMGLSQRG